LDQEQSILKQELDRELSHLKFSKQADVIRRTHPTTLRGRLRALWNKELELPVIPLGTAFALLFTAAFLYHGGRQPKSHPEPVPGGTPEQRVLIEAGGSIYWKDEIERRLSQHENPNQG